MKLGDILDRTLRRHPDACAFWFGSRPFTFRQVATAVVRLAAQINNHRIVERAPVAILMPNIPAFSIAYFAILRVGGIVVPINPRLTDHEILMQLKDCDPELIIVDEEQLLRVEEILENRIPCLSAPRNPCDLPANHSEECTAQTFSWQPDGNPPDETAVIIYTSGTTGLPKGVELTHRNLIFNARSVNEEKFSTEGETNVLGPGHVGLAALPLSHAFGQTNLQNGLWYGGGAIVYQERFDPAEALQLLTTHHITFFAGVPTMIQELVRVGREQGVGSLSLRFCVCGGAALSSSTKLEFGKIFGVGIQESYGLSETSPMISCQNINRTYKAGCVGRPINQCEIQLVNEQNEEVPNGFLGEILVRGPNVFKGYLRNPEATAAVFYKEWFKTGDIGKIDHDGELVIVDRKKEIIKSGGYTVYPREIENVILEIESVSQAVVIGISDQKYGEAVKAIVCLRSNASETENSTNPAEYVAPVIAEIQSVCKKKLASYKRPRIVEVREKMPLGSTGKIDRLALREIRISP